MMSHFDIFLIVASFLVPLFLAIQLFTDKRKTISRSIMAHTQLFAAIVFLLLYFYLVEDYRIYIPLHSLHATFEFLLFPFLYIYVKSVVSPSFELIKKWPHLMPAFIVLIGGTYIFYFYYDYNEILVAYSSDIFLPYFSNREQIKGTQYSVGMQSKCSISPNI
jgi:hypothetical protein